MTKPIIYVAHNVECMKAVPPHRYPYEQLFKEVDVMDKDEWLLCPFCKGKTRTRIRPDTTLTNYPLFCPKCKHETLVNVKQLNMSVIKALDASVRFASER